MSRIPDIIQPAGFELIRDRLGEILTDEIDTQAMLTYDTYFEKVKVWAERATPFGKEELPAVNITLHGGDYSNKNYGSSVDGEYKFNIDIHTNSAGEANTPGDKLAAIKLQKLIRLCRSILENSVYKTLGFAPGFIMRVGYSGFLIADMGDKPDAANTSMSRLVFVVACNETTPALNVNLIAGYETHIKLHETDNGYFYAG